MSDSPSTAHRSLRDRLFRRPPQVIDATTAYQQLQDGAITLLDVRETNEWNAGRAPGARHMPLGHLNPAQLPTDRPVVTVCRSGSRSARAASQLRAAGLDVMNLRGGMSSWVHHDLPLIAAGNKPGRLV
ncbi:MAG: rhodanese-like domain-containing protein [Jatrophihabitantaceae bacterium]